MVYLEFSGSSLNNLLLNGTLRDKSIDDHLLLLPESVSSINGLQINLRVPVRVENDDHVCLVQVDAKATSTCGQYEKLFVRIFSLEVVNSLLTVICACLAINAAVFVASPSEEVI